LNDGQIEQAIGFLAGKPLAGNSAADDDNLFLT
jgi:hypothetical protein